jgi:hypothetical protein
MREDVLLQEEAGERQAGEDVGAGTGCGGALFLRKVGSDSRRSRVGLGGGGRDSAVFGET